MTVFQNNVKIDCDKRTETGTEGMLFMKIKMSLPIVCVCLFCMTACQHQTPMQAGNSFLSDLSLIKEGSTQRSSSCDADLENGNADARFIAPGGCLVIADLEGPGVIQHIWNTVAAVDRGYSRLLVLRMYWDGESNPSVEVPLGDFFAMGHGLDHPMESFPVTVTSEGRARNCYWPMPFRKSARITVTNEGDGPVHAFYYYVDWTKVDRLPENTAYFHAMYRQEHPAVSGKHYLIADIEGRGHYVGTVLNVRQHFPHWWGEGDDFWFIDGAEKPHLRGTGSEDYFCDAWGLREMSTPWYGAPLMEGYESLARTSCYRWHIPDPVVFEKSLRLEIEHMGVTYNEDGTISSYFAERDDDFSSVAFWYQTEPHKAYESLAPALERVYGGWAELIEAETKIDQCSVSHGAFAVQPEIGYNGGQIFWTPQEPNGYLELEVDIDKDQVQELALMLTCARDYGTFQVLLDGIPLGAPVNLYGKGINQKEFRFLVPACTPGKHILRFENRGKSPESIGYFFGLDAFMFM